MSFLVWLLDATTAGRIVAGNGQADDAAVAELLRLLHKSLAEGAAADNRASVVVLNSAGEYLARAGTSFIHKHHERQLLECASPVAAELLARTLAALCIDNQLARRQELVDHLDGDVHVAALVAAEVDDELLHAFHVEVGQGDKHLGVGLLAEVLDADVARLVAHHVVGIDADHGNVATNDGEVLQVLYAVTLYAELDLRAFLAFQMLHDGVALHADERCGVGRDDAVACQDAHLLSRTRVDDGHHVDGVLLHRELHADAAEAAFQALVGFLSILRPEVAAMRVELAEYERHGVLDERVHVDRIDVDVVDELQQVAHLV